MTNELHFGLYYFSNDTKVVVHGSKMKENLGVTIWHWTWGWSIQHGWRRAHSLEATHDSNVYYKFTLLNICYWQYRALLFHCVYKQQWLICLPHRNTHLDMPKNKQIRHLLKNSHAIGLDSSFRKKCRCVRVWVSARWRGGAVLCLCLCLRMPYQPSDPVIPITTDITDSITQCSCVFVIPSPLHSFSLSFSHYKHGVYKKSSPPAKTLDCFLAEISSKTQRNLILCFHKTQSFLHPIFWWMIDFTFLCKTNI